MRWGTALDWREGPAFGGWAVGISFIPKLNLCLSSPTRLGPQEMPTSGGGSRWVRTGPLSDTEELGSVGLGAMWRQGMALLHAILATQTKLRVPSCLPSSLALSWCSHASGTAGDV